MKVNKINIILIPLAIHLFTTNSKLIYHLNPDKLSIRDTVQIEVFNYDSEGNIMPVFDETGNQIHMYEQKIESMEPLFSFKNITDEFTIISLITSLAYSIMTVFILSNFTGSTLVFFIMYTWFAALDGLGVYVYYVVPENYSAWGAWYFSVYTMSIIIAFGLYKHLNKQLSVGEQIMALKAKGISVDEIAKKFGWSTSKIYRIIREPE